MSWSRRKLLQTGMAASAAAAALSPLRATAQAAPPSVPEPGSPVNENILPYAARIAIADLIDHGAHIQSGQKVLLIAYLDGLYGGDNLVDRQAIHWIQRSIEERGNPVELLWVDEPTRPHQWKFPAQVRTAMDRNDVSINHSFDLTIEEISAFRQYIEHENPGAPAVRNFATTASLLCTSWAQTPQELVSEIRFQASRRIQAGLKWELSDPLGTHLEGKILPALNVTNAEHSYAVRREDSHTYYPWPEWICPPIVLEGTSGTFVFDRMLSWWSRYIGIAPYFDHPISLTIRDGRILKIDGGREAEALRAFLAMLKGKLGDAVYAFDTMHFGVHPQARVAPQQCPSALYRRVIEHSDAHNLHAHIGSAKATKEYPYWPHITGDLRQPTFKIGDRLVHDNGRLTALDDPEVLAIVKKYPGRPGILPEPFQG